jgi:hypothetical protein
MFQLAVKILIVGLVVWLFFVLVSRFWKRTYGNKTRPEDEKYG